MDSRSLEYVVQACQGRLLTGALDARVSGVSTDSRRIAAGDLFFAIVGEKFDAHDYLAEVSRKGAAAVVVAGAKAGRASGLSPSMGVVAVDDPRAALGRLASCYRAQFNLPIVAVGGSNGKTTTKELLASILRQKGHTLWSEASF